MVVVLAVVVALVVVVVVVNVNDFRIGCFAGSFHSLVQYLVDGSGLGASSAKDVLSAGRDIAAGNVR